MESRAAVRHCAAGTHRSKAATGLGVPVLALAAVAWGLAVPVAPPAPTARSVAEWEALFVSAWPAEYNTYLPMSTSADAWDLYNLAYAVDANTAMFRASGKTQYLDRALLYVQNTIGKAKPSSSIPTSQYASSTTSSYLAWVNHSHPDLGNDGKEYPLMESYLWRYVATLLRVMRTTPAVYDNAGYRAKYDAVLAFTEKHIWEKWYRRGTGNLYRSNTHMASHWARIALDLSIVSTDAARLPQYVQVRRNIDHLGVPGGPSDTGLRGQMITLGRPARFFWHADWGTYAAPGQDVSHGNAIAAYVAEARDLGYAWTTADVAKLVATFEQEIYKTTTRSAAFVDGSGDQAAWFSDGWVKLGRYSATVQARMEAHGAGRGTQLYGNGALNARLLASFAPALVATPASGFHNTPLFAPQSGTFTVHFDAVASTATNDATIALCRGTQSAYGGLAAIVRMNGAGRIDARDGDQYAAQSKVPYAAGVSYHFRVEVNVPAHSYSVYVTPPGGAERVIGTGLAFRDEQSAVPSLDTWNVRNALPAGSTLTVRNFAVR
jgi:hypothetical protein